MEMFVHHETDDGTLRTTKHQKTELAKKFFNKDALFKTLCPVNDTQIQLVLSHCTRAAAPIFSR